MIFFIKLYVIGYNTQFQFDQRLKKRVFSFRTAVLNKSVLYNHYFSHIRNRSVWVFVIYRLSPCQVNFSPAKMGKAKRSQNKQRYEISSHETIPYNTKRQTTTRNEISQGRSHDFSKGGVTLCQSEGTHQIVTMAKVSSWQFRHLL